MAVDKVKAVFLVGKCGLGKSTFCNALTASNHPSSDSMLGVTREPIEAACTLDDETFMTVDFPGTGDVAAPGQEPLKDEEIYAMIAQKAAIYNVVAVIVFVSQEDILGPRLPSHFVGLVSTIKNRFRGLESVAYFAISGQSMPGDIQEFMADAMRKYASGKFTAMGLTATNWSRCKKKDFSGPITFCHKRLKSQNSVCLVPREFLDTCTNCHLIGDPLFETGPCRWHTQEQGAVHSTHTYQYHRLGTSFAHRGQWLVNGWCSGKWTCCNITTRDQQCLKETYDCCEKVSLPCQRGNGPSAQKCMDCHRDVSQQGCKGVCQNCGQLMSSNGCVDTSTHNWRKGVAEALVEGLVNVPTTDNEDAEFNSEYIERLLSSDEYEKKPHETSYGHQTRLTRTLMGIFRSSNASNSDSKECQALPEYVKEL